MMQLLTRLNLISRRFLEENGIPVDDFGYLAYLIRQICPQAGFGKKQLQDPRELDEEIEAVRDAYTELVNAFRNARDRFSICTRRDGFTNQMEDFASDYRLWQSEYGLCFERGVKSIICGDRENYEDYSFVADGLRGIDKTDPDEVSTSREFADA